MYGDGDDYWRMKAANLQEHPKHVLNNYAKEKKHSAAKAKIIDVKSMLSRGKVYKQSCKSEKGLSKNKKKKKLLCYQKVSENHLLCRP